MSNKEEDNGLTWGGCFMLVIAWSYVTIVMCATMFLGGWFLKNYALLPLLNK